jgi:hypothetical protein
MSNIGTTNLNTNQSMNRRSFLMNTIKAGALFALTGPLLLSKKTLAGEFKGETLSLLLIQPHKISGDVLAKRFEEQTGAKLNVTIVPYDAIEALPYDGDSHVLFYNTSILERNHVPVPNTWDDYLQGVKTISQAESKNGVYGAIIMGAAVPVIVGSLFANRFAGFGGNFLKSDGSPDIVPRSLFCWPMPLFRRCRAT